MVQLPPELVHQIFSHLSPSDARSLRLCCKALANIGAHWGFRTISFYLCRADFKKLYEVAHHPIIRNHVKSLVYHAANLEEPVKTLDEYIEETKSSFSRRRVESCAENWLPAGVLLKEHPQNCTAYDLDPISPADISENYAQYVRAMEEQRRILSTKQDFILLKEVIPKLTQLQTIFISNDGWQSIPHDSSPFDPFFVCSGSSHQPHGARQTAAVLHGLKDSGVALASFGAGTIDVSLVNQSFLDEILEACNGLKSIDLIFDTIDIEAPMLALNTTAIVDRARHQTETGIIAEFLKAIPSLTDISIGFTMASEMPLRYPSTLSNIITDGFKWKNLRRIRLFAIESERQDLMAFFELHKETLRSVELRDCRLITTSWTRLLRQMKNMLRLDHISLTDLIYGMVESEEDYPPALPPPDAGSTRECWWLGDPSIESGPCLANDLASWYLHDGPFPLGHWQIRSW
ncbi:hypothetical protein F5X99DRAFT_417045 [Biscogniauxia marginata]|nr:hypothetical protein F5X99DRAFT_417045 [Biscogniauxia marginata]